MKLATLNGKGVVFGDVAQPICMPTSESAYQPGTWCSVSGWGMQKRNYTTSIIITWLFLLMPIPTDSTAKDEESVSNVLKVASVPILSSETCIKKEVYGNQLSTESFPDGMLCAGYLEGGIDACRGDSGGPLACSVNGKIFILLLPTVRRILMSVIF